MDPIPRDRMRVDDGNAKDRVVMGGSFQVNPGETFFPPFTPFSACAAGISPLSWYEVHCRVNIASPLSHCPASSPCTDGGTKKGTCHENALRSASRLCTDGPVDVLIAMRVRHERRLKLRRGKIDPPVQHFPEVDGESPRIRRQGSGIINHSRRREEEGGHRTPPCYSSGEVRGNGPPLVSPPQAVPISFQGAGRTSRRPRGERAFPCRPSWQRIAGESPGLVHRSARSNHFHDLFSSAVCATGRPPPIIFPSVVRSGVTP